MYFADIEPVAHKVGETVNWRGSFGTDAPVEAVVTDNDDEQNGKRVYGLDNGNWAYGFQLSAI
jgi:hypothetical protein